MSNGAKAGILLIAFYAFTAGMVVGSYVFAR